MRKPKSYLKNKYRAELNALRNAIHRCHNPAHTNYSNYGARGIVVADAWRAENGFALFLDHIGPRPNSDYSLDRIDNNRGYEANNVRWTDRKTQQNNRRPTRIGVQDFGWGVGYSKPIGTGQGYGRKLSPLIPHMGRTQTLAEWATELNMCAATIRYRLMRGLGPDDALNPCTSRRGEKRKMGPNELLLPTIH